MNEPLNTTPDRREFIRSAARYLALGGLVFTGGLLAWRRKSSARQECINLEICKGCPAFNGCGLPPALAHKTTTGDESHAG